MAGKPGIREEYRAVSAYEIYEKLLYEQKRTSYKVSKATGIATSTLTKWKQGEYMPKRDKLQKIADYLGVRLEFLTGESPYRTDEDFINSFKTGDSKTGIRIPDYDSIPADIYSGKTVKTVGWKEITGDAAKNSEFFGLRVQGDFMLPRIAEGDTVIVHRQPEAESGDVVIATLKDNTTVCRRIMKCPDGIILISFNPVYKPEYYTNADIRSLPVHIIGKVVENRQKY
jgi:repressor LexA